MGTEVKQLMISLLSNIYGQRRNWPRKLGRKKPNLTFFTCSELKRIKKSLEAQILTMGLKLGDKLIERERYRYSQELLCEIIDVALHFLADDAHPPMRFSLTPPPAKSPHIVTSPTNRNNNNSSDCNKQFRSNCKQSISPSARKSLNNNMQATKPRTSGARTVVGAELTNTDVSIDTAAEEATSDYNQWLHAMKLVARLPGGMPPEFRRKLWLTLADKYLKSKNVDWSEEEKKCFSEEWREDDEELGIQIVKDLHRTGSNICTGPAAQVNQAKLKRILLGYARYNPEVGYCQGFNMLGALILQVMDKEEVESMKVMIYLVEGILPPGYFCGSMGGLQADMGVFRELMQSKLPRLARHLEKLQGPIENAYEPPLTNVFTMQWFLTLFCTCLPMTCVLRVWDLVLIEGSDVLLRTALVLWSLLEDRVVSTRSADDFYGKMGSFAGELLNGHLIDSNSLIEKVVQLGPIKDIEKLRNKHLFNITPLRHKSNLPLFIGDEESENDEESRLAIATVWGMPWARRGSQGSKQAPNADNKERLALDISLLKKQYDRLRERQKQAHIIITTACSTSRQNAASNVSPSVMPVNQLLMGRSAIVTNQGKRVGPLVGAVPPARKPSLPTILQTRPIEKQLKRGETLHWRDTDADKRRRDSLTWKEIKADRAVLLKEPSTTSNQSRKLYRRVGKSDSSSYSEESDNEGSSTDTSLCDDDPKSNSDKTAMSSTENSPKRRNKSNRKQKGSVSKLLTINNATTVEHKERTRPKSWAPTSTEIPFTLMTPDQDMDADSVEHVKEAEDSTTECDRHPFKISSEQGWLPKTYGYSPIAGDLATTTLGPLSIQTGTLELPAITSTSQLSPMPDIISYLKDTSISPLPTPKPSLLDSTNSLGSGDGDESKKFDVNDDGVTNEYFERVNNIERPTRLELFHSHNKEGNKDAPPKHEFKSNTSTTPNVSDVDRTEIQIETTAVENLSIQNNRDFPLEERDSYIPGENLDDFKEQNTASEVVTKSGNDNIEMQSVPTHVSRAAQKRRDPRRLTLTRSTTIEIEERYQALEKRMSTEIVEEILKPKKKEVHFQAESSVKEENNLTTYHENVKKENDRNITLDPQEHKTCSDTDKLEEILDCSEKPAIPSTAELEKRFTRQMSASTQSSKEEIKLKSNDEEKNTFRRSDSDKDSSKNCKERNESLQQPESSTKGETDKNKEDDVENEKKPKLKKLPTTAELEDRFNALERRMSIEKSSPKKSKKEPPDIIPQNDTSSKSKNSAIKPETEEKSMQEKDLKRPETTEHKKGNDIQKKKLSPEDINNSVNNSENKKLSPQEDSKKPLDLETNRRTEKNVKKDNSSDEKKSTKSQDVKVDSNNTEKVKKKTPPSTEELEQRFKALEKQMSTTNLKNTERDNESKEKKTQTESETVKDQQSKATKPKQQKIVEETAKSPERSNEKSRRASEPPSTEDLEKRYETFKRRMSTRQSVEVHTETIDEALQRIENEIISESKKLKDATVEHNLKEISNSKKVVETKNQIASPTEISPSNDANLNSAPNKVTKDNQIPNAPPLPAEEPKKIIPNVPVRKERQALIEELQSKIKEQENDDQLKPSSINPNRKPPPMPVDPLLSSKHDEISETHAPRDFLRSKNYEPWYVQAQKTVRRFSDLPSRADLENRLDFLEQKFYHKLYKQRCASDSEIASREQLMNNKIQNRQTNEGSIDVNLEKRLQALEKQLSENSLKLLEAMRQNDKASETSSDKESPRRLSTNTIDASGKELVRYASEVEEDGNRKPINISISIKMMVDKTAEMGPGEEISNTTAHLEKRLRLLEEQLKASVEKRNATSSEALVEVIAAEFKEHTVEQSKESSVESPITTDEKEEIAKESFIESKICYKENKVCSTVEKVEEAKHEKVEEAKLDGKTDQCHEETSIGKEKMSSENAVPEDHTTTKETENSSEKEHKNNTKMEENMTIACKTGNETSQACDLVSNQLVINTSEVGEVDPNKKTMVLLLDNEPKAVKVRRLTRANTEELEGLFEALEKQLSERNLVKSEDGKLRHAPDKPSTTEPVNSAISDLAKEIESFTTTDDTKNKKTEIISAKDVQKDTKKEEVENAPKCAKKDTKKDDKKSVKSGEPAEAYDWGPDPIKRHLKRKTVHLPSTKELESRFRSLERQIKLLEDVEQIDVEQRLQEIERKIKLQYSLANEKDLTKYLELCEGKGLDDEPNVTNIEEESRCECGRKTPTKTKEKTPHTSPTRYSRDYKSPVSPSRGTGSTPVKQKSIKFQTVEKGKTSVTIDKEDPHSPTRLKHSKSNERLLNKSKSVDLKKQPIHPLEMLLDPSPDASKIPTTGELEHRIRVLNRQRSSSTSPHRQRSRSPAHQQAESPVKSRLARYEKFVLSPEKPEPPTAEELEARMRALEEEFSFDSKTQKNFKDFNEKLKNVMTPSPSFEEYKTTKSRDVSPRHYTESYRSTTPKHNLRSTSPKVLRFQEEDDYSTRIKLHSEQLPSARYEDIDYRRTVGNDNDVLKTIEENSKILHRILKKTIADSSSSSRLASYGASSSALASEGLDAMGSRLMRETSPITRTGTHTGIPLRTDDNINERLSSIKDTIKSIDSLCEEKLYHKEKCQRYIDSLFSDSVHFSQKKPSLEELRSRSASHTRRSEYTPAIHINDAGYRPSDYSLIRSIGSAESIRTVSPLRAASPLHHRSNREISRNMDPSPGQRGRRINEEREEYESRVRRDYMLPNFIFDINSDLRSSGSSLTKFCKVDSQLEPYERDRSISHSTSRSPMRLSYGSRETITQQNTSTKNNYTTLSRGDLDRQSSPYRQTTHNLLGTESLRHSQTPVYNPTKLEIRHTTVTSTFYDRLLTEKQLEKSISRTPSRSPINVFPTATTTEKSSSDHNSITNSNTESNAYSERFKYSPSYNANYSSANTTLHQNTNTKLHTATTPTGNFNSSLFSQQYLGPTTQSATASNTDLRIRSCENILMQLHSTSTTTAALMTRTATTCNTTGVTANSLINAFTTSFTSLTTTVTTTTTDSTLSTYYPHTFASVTATTLPSLICSVAESTNTRSSSDYPYLNLMKSSTVSTSNISSLPQMNFSQFAPMTASTTCSANVTTSSTYHPLNVQSFSSSFTSGTGMSTGVSNPLMSMPICATTSESNSYLNILNTSASSSIGSQYSTNFSKT